MNDDEFLSWQVYLRDVADMLGLKDREITLQRTWPEEENSFAEVFCTTETVQAVVRMHPTFFALDLEAQRRVVCHELIHLHLASVYEHVKWAIDHADASPLLAALPSLVLSDIEGVTDRLSYIVAPMVPLPYWSVGKGEHAP